MEVLELLWAAAPVFEHPQSRKPTKWMETKPQINQNMFCFYQVLYKDFTTCALHFSSFLCAFLRSLSASSLPLTMVALQWTHSHMSGLCTGDTKTGHRISDAISLGLSRQGEKSLRWPAGHALAAIAQCGAGLCHRSAPVLTRVEPVVHQVPLWRAAYQPHVSQPVLVHWVIPSQKQDFILVEPFDVPASPFLYPIQVPLNSSPATVWDFCWYMQRNCI